MRFFALTAIVALIPGSLTSSASGKKILDRQQLANLETKAAEARPDEQGCLYAKLVDSTAEFITVQMQTGKDMEAYTSLKSVQSYASKIDMSSVRKTRKIKNTELRIRHAVFQLKGLLFGASLEERPTLEATLNELNKLQEKLMLQVFSR